MEPPPLPSPPSRGSFDDVYRANGSGLLSVASSASLTDKSRAALGDFGEDGDGDGDGDDDTNMSNGDAMSETSSLEAIALEPEDAMELLFDDGDGSDGDAVRSPPPHRRPASFHGLPAIHTMPAAAESPRPPPHHYHLVARAASLDAYTPGSSASTSSSLPLAWTDATGTPTAASETWPLSPRKRKRKTMVLHCHFAPAMSKSVARTAPHRQLLDTEDDDLMNGVRPSESGHTDAQNALAKVEWAHTESCADDREGVHLVAAKNQVVGTQLRVLSNAPFQLTTDRTNWFLPQGHTPRCRVAVETAYLPQAIQVDVLLVGHVEDERGDRVMETLERRTSSEALALEHAVYVRVRVGAAAAEGNYEVPVRLFTQHAGFTDEELSWATTIHVRVANVVLPAPADWAFHLDLWQHHSAVARAHGGVPLWSDHHFALLDRYFASLAELGQKCLTVVATEMPWAGQQCYTETSYPSALFEHAVLDVYEDAKDGRLSIDFQHFDRLLALAEKHHMATEIEVFGLFSIWKDPAHGFDSPVEAAASTAAASGDRASLTGSSSSSSAETPASQRKDSAASSGGGGGAERPLDSWRIRCVHRHTQRVRYLKSMAEIESFLSLFYEHCVARALVDRVRVCADEPSELPAFYAQMAFLERLAPRFKVKVALNHLDFLHYAPPQVVDFVPLLPLVCADRAVTARWHAQIREAKRGRFCWYVCCGPSYPNQFVSSPLAESELVGFLTHFLGLDGFLRWNFCLWPARPWSDLRWRSPAWKVGDMYFVLPGADGGPVETLRFEALRFAVQSFELLRLARARLAAAEFARLEADVAALVWRAPGRAHFGKYLEHARAAEDLYSLDPRDYEHARRLVIDALALAASLDPKHHAATAAATSSAGDAVTESNSPGASIVPEPAPLLSPSQRGLPTSPRKRSCHGA